MGLLDDIKAATRSNAQRLGGLIDIDSTGNGLLSDLDYAKRNALSRLKYNIGSNLDSAGRYLSGDPNHWLRQASTPESSAAIDEALMSYGPSEGLAGKIDVSHGSPHKFARFDFSKIGTGEGAQAYGHGGYFAQGFDSPVAYQYAEALGSKNQDLVSNVINRVVRHHGGDTSKVRSELAIEGLPNELITPELESSISRIIRGTDPTDGSVSSSALKEYGALESLAPKESHLYNVELKWPDAAREAADPLGEHHLLDWDAPLSEQPSPVREALSGLNLPAGTYGENPVGAHAYAEMSKRLDQGDQELLQSVKQHSNLFAESPELVSAWLKSKGIPGIRYLDQGSRGAGTGSRNFVIFDDRIPNIVTRNGKSLLED